MLRHAMLCYPDHDKRNQAKNLRNGRWPTNGQNKTLFSGLCYNFLLVVSTNAIPT